MAVSKLSQIANSPAATATTFLVGVDQAGPTDYLYTPGQVGGTVPSGGNLTFYVATTGSDSNPGTSGSPWATPQHAFNVVGTYNWGGIYYPTVNFANGTYNISGSLNLPQLFGIAPQASIGRGRAIYQIASQIPRTLGSTLTCPNSASVRKVDGRAVGAAEGWPGTGAH